MPPLGKKSRPVRVENELRPLCRNPQDKIGKVVLTPLRQHSPMAQTVRAALTGAGRLLWRRCLAQQDADTSFLVEHDDSGYLQSAPYRLD
jgi:hypothetical protein